MVEVRILGTVEVIGHGGMRADVGGPRPTSLLVALALAAGSHVSADRLTEEIWGSAPPRSAPQSLQSHLSRLRRVLEPDRAAHAPASALVRTAAGYRLDPAEVDVDGRRFEAEVARGREALARGEQLDAVEAWTAALARWRGPVGHGIDLGASSRAEATRLEELRLTAAEERATTLLALGEHEASISDLEPLVTAHPVRERLHALWMLALYRSGRQAEALAAYRHLRSALVETLGVEPEPRVVRLHERILAQDQALLPPGGGTGELFGPDPRGPVASPQPAGTGPGPRTPGNVPAAIVGLIGRQEQRVRLAAELERSRLVTLTGAGGCGKTQLALQVARDTVPRFPDGTWVVELAACRDPDAVAGVVAEALGVDDAPLPGLIEDLAARLGGRRSLLVLDNCEHLVDASAGLVQALLRRCSDLRVLTTSRQILDLEGEVAWRVPSLSLPPEGAGLRHLAGSDAAQLFLARAAEVRPGFEPTEDDAAAIAAICRELDGIPLAIELAASRLRVLAPREIADRLDDRFSVLRSSRRGAPPRHRTLDAAIAWSYELLDPAAQRLFRRLAVFESGFGVAAAEAVCTDAALPAGQILDLLDELVGRSLVVAGSASDGSVRHHLMQSIRSFARARWTDEERHTAATRHASWFAHLGDLAAAELTRRDQVRWLNQLHADHADIRAALGWCLEDGHPELALRIVRGVWWFWLQFGHAREGVTWLSEVLAGVDPDAAHDAGLLAQVTYAAGRLAGATGDGPGAVAWLEEATERAATADEQGWLALGHARLGQQRQIAGWRDEAARHLRRADAAARHRDDPWVLAGVSDVAGHLALAAGDLDAASAAFHASERHYLGAEDRWSACLARLGRAWVARQAGDVAAALELHRENLVATRTLTRSAFDFVGLARDLRGVAALASSCRHDELAARLCGASETLRTMGEVALTSAERDEVDTVLEAATVAVGEAAVRTAKAEGQLLGADEALDAALEAIEVLQAGPELARSTAAP